MRRRNFIVGAAAAPTLATLTTYGRRRTALLAGKDAQQRRLLFGCRTVVNKDLGAPVAAQRRPGNKNIGGEGEPGDIDTVDLVCHDPHASEAPITENFLPAGYAAVSPDLGT